MMDELSMILLKIPIFFPKSMVMDFGMSQELTAIWFGIPVLTTVGFYGEQATIPCLRNQALPTLQGQAPGKF